MAPIDSPIASAVTAFLAQRSTDRREERELLDLLSACPAADLDLAVATVDLGALIRSVDDRVFGPDNRSALLRLLTEERVGDLGVTARAALVRALQRGRTDGEDERAVGALFLATRGAALTALKELLDAATDYHDLVQLLFHDIDDGDVRAAILSHIAAEASAVAGPAALKILSDIDDTLYANWVDKRYPAKTVYPGVRQLYAELAGSPLDPLAAAVTFVTARPGDRLGVSENATHRSLAERGLPRARVLAGAFTRLLGNDLIAEEKLANFERYRSVFPEHRFVFFGDSGQGDVRFGEHMRARAPGSVPLVLIHDVVATPEERRRELGAGGVHLCDTYAGAALALFEAGLLGAEGLARVVAAAESELAVITFASDVERSARAEDLGRDVVRARAAVEAARQMAAQGRSGDLL